MFIANNSYFPVIIDALFVDKSRNPSQFGLTEEFKDDDNLPSAHTDCEVLIPNNQDALQKGLSDLELYTLPVPGDGHCFLTSF